MKGASQITQPTQIIVTLEGNATTSEIKKTLKMIRGVASVRIARLSDDAIISPTIQKNIKKAREESACGETIVCNSPEEMQKYFDSL